MVLSVSCKQMCRGFVLSYLFMNRVLGKPLKKQEQWKKNITM